MASIFLTRTKETDRAPLGAFSRPINAFFPQLQAYVANHLGSDTVRYFAEPVRESGNEVTDWFAEADAQPRPWSDVAGVERREAIAQLNEWRQQLLNFANGQAPFGSEEIHRILKLCLGEPSSEDLYVADGQPIVINWGFEPPVEFQPIQDVKSGFPNQTSENPTVIRQDPPQKVGLSALTYCMIFALCCALLAWMIALLVDRPTGLDGITSPEVGPKVAELEKLQAMNERLQAEIDDTKTAHLNKLLTCVAQCSGPALQTPVLPKDDTTPEDDKGEPLTVPKDAEDKDDLSFLEGIWRSVSDRLFLERSDGSEPRVVVEFKLDKNGKGTRTVQVEGGISCTGVVEAYFEDAERLIISEIDPAKCNDGSLITPYKVVCSILPNRVADCNLTPRDDPSAKSVQTDLRRVR